LYTYCISSTIKEKRKRAREITQTQKAKIMTLLTPLTHEQKMEIAQNIINRNDEIIRMQEASNTFGKIAFASNLIFLASASVFLALQTVTIYTVFASVVLFIYALVSFRH
jgi:hypothetical protein